MADFPTLKSGAVAQYPMECTLRRQTETVRFLDGSSQRFRLMKPLRRWKINLSGLDARELDTLIDFVEQQEGSPFSFVDPMSGETVPSCVVTGRGLESSAVDEWDHGAVLTIEEVA